MLNDGDVFVLHMKLMSSHVAVSLEMRRMGVRVTLITCLSGQKKMVGGCKTVRDGHGSRPSFYAHTHKEKLTCYVRLD